MDAGRMQNEGESAGPTVQLLLDAFERVHELVPTVIAGLTVEELLWRPDADANPVGWLVWHLTRVQDDHLADLDGSEQVWVEDAWAEKFSLPYDESSVGFGQSTDEVGEFTLTTPNLLHQYHKAVHARTTDILGGLSDEDYERVIDDSYDPPVTLGHVLSA